MAPSTTPSTTAAPTTTAPPPRTVSVGAPFGVRVGEAVNVSGVGLSVTFSKVVSDSRCRPGQQCLVAGDATIAVAVATAGRAPGSLTLNTDAPKSARYGSRTVELVRLGSGSAPTATLRVS